MDIKVLEGKTLKDIIVSEDEILFKCTDGKKYKLYHWQDCCESVYIEDICGYIEDLIGSPILSADEVSDDNYECAWERGFEGDRYPDSHTWTFYKISNTETDVTIRWFGESNGYYSEAVYFEEVN